MKNKKLFRDIIFALSLLLVCGTAVLVMRLVSSDGTKAVIYVNGTEYGSYPLENDAEIEVKTKYGENTVVIKDGEVFVKDASCPDKICEKTHSVSRGGESIVCLPNRMSVRIVSEKESVVDIAG